MASRSSELADSTAYGSDKGVTIMVAAIDIRNTYSTYAFSLKSDYEEDPSNIYVNHYWETGSMSLISPKTPTCVLFDTKQEFHSFGCQAVNFYADLVLNGQHNEWHFFKKFKIQLHAKQINTDVEVEDDRGRKMPAKKVFGEAIRYLKNHLLDSLKKRGVGIEFKDIHWVLTVPAIWCDSAKQCMREAACVADIDASRLSIALEPETASLYCQLLPKENIHGSIEAQVDFESPGSKFMIIDLRGCTAEITVYERRANGGLKERQKPVGGPWGGDCIDEAFTQLLITIVGAPVYKKFMENTSDHIDIQREMESKKRTITPSTEGKVTMKVPITFGAVYEEEKNEKIKIGIENSPLKGKVVCLGNKLRINADLIKGLFTVCVDNIVQNVQQLLKDPKVKGTNTFIMVGGFSNSAMIQDAIKNALPGGNILIPKDAELAMVKGAVIFGHKVLWSSKQQDPIQKQKYIIEEQQRDNEEQLWGKEEQLRDQENQIENWRTQLQSRKENATKHKDMTLAYQDERKKCKILADEMEKEIRDKDEKIIKLQTKTDDLSFRITSFEEQLRDKKEQLRDKEKQIVNWRTQIQSKDGTINHLQQQIENSEGRIKALEEDKKENETKHKAMALAYQDERKKGKSLAAEMEKEIRDRDEKISKLQTENDELSSRLLEETSRSDMLRVGHDEFVEPECSSCETAKTRLNSIEQQLRDKDVQLRDKDEQLRDKEDQIKTWRTQLQSKDGTIHHLQHQNEANEGRIKALEEDKKENATKHKNMKSAFEDERNEVKIVAAETAKKLSDRDETINKLETDKTESSSRINNIEQQLRDKDVQLRDKENQIETWRTQLQSKDGAIHHLQHQNEANEGRIKALEEDKKEYAAENKYMTSAFEDERNKVKIVAAETAKELYDRNETINKLEKEQRELFSRCNLILVGMVMLAILLQALYAVYGFA